MNENQSIISQKFYSIFRGKNQHRCCGPDETAEDTKDCLSDTIRKCQNSSGGSSENHRGISIIQHFRQVQLNYMICMGRQQIQTFLCEEWFCRVYFDRENLQGGFSRGAETGFTIEYQPTFKLFLAAPVLIIFLLRLNNKSNFRTIQ